MAWQTGKNMLVAIARESTTGTAAVVGATCSEIRPLPSPGLKLSRARIKSNEVTDSGISPMGRLGFKSVDGSYNAEATIGGATDMLIEAIMRGTWSASSALTTATGAGACVDLTAASTSTITRTGSGSFITDGWKVGDIARLANYSTAANNDINLRVITVAAGTLTFAGTPLTVGSADTACTLTRLKKVINPATPTRYSHTIEQNYQDIDLSELFLGCRLVGLKISAKPGQPVQLTYTFMGLDRTALVNGTSPWFTTPVLTTGVALIADDSLIMVAGSASTAIGLSGIELEFKIAAKGEPIIGSLVSLDLFDNELEVTGSITGLATDFADLTKYDAETEFEVSALFAEPGSLPQSCLAAFLGRVKIADISRDLGGDGAQIVTKQIMIGPKVAATGYDASVATFSSSAA